jgi:hypothetical protein
MIELPLIKFSKQERIPAILHSNNRTAKQNYLSGVWEGE